MTKPRISARDKKIFAYQIITYILLFSSVIALFILFTNIRFFFYASPETVWAIITITGLVSPLISTSMRKLRKNKNVRQIKTSKGIILLSKNKGNEWVANIHNALGAFSATLFGIFTFSIIMSITFFGSLVNYPLYVPVIIFLVSFYNLAREKTHNLTIFGVALLILFVLGWWMLGFSYIAFTGMLWLFAILLLIADLGTALTNP